MIKRIYYNKVGDSLDTMVVLLAVFEQIEKGIDKVVIRVGVFGCGNILAEHIYDGIFRQIADEYGFEILKEGVNWNEHDEILAYALVQKKDIVYDGQYTKYLKREVAKLLEFYVSDEEIKELLSFRQLSRY